jgi:GNAT superfamily N-acetyltransferase
MTTPARTGQIVVRPAREVPWTDLQTVFGTKGDPSGCWCQWFKADKDAWRRSSRTELAERMRAQTGCDDPDAQATNGLVAYLDGEPAGWCAVEPRTAYPRLRTARVPWSGRQEDREDPGVWAVTCFVTRAGFRRRGVSQALAAAAAEHARRHGAHAVEGYPIDVAHGPVGDDVLYVGAMAVFARAGFAEVSRPTPRRVVMRLDL